MHYLVLGGGPAGLTLAHRLQQLGETSFLILEKENTAGGLCRSVNVDNAPFDIGGGHFLDVKRPAVNSFLFGFMPIEEWDLYERNSQISISGNMINSPIEANIWQMDLENQIEYLKAIAIAGCNLGEEMPSRFIDWIYWKLGRKIAEDYMLPYNRKMFADELDELGTYWLDKLPNVSFDETLMSCLTHKAYGTQPGHAQFYYPKKYGYGELWLRMAEELREHIVYNQKVCGIDFTKKMVKTKDDAKYQFDILVTTIPWNEFTQLAGMPDDIKNSIRSLKHSSIETRYFPENLNTDAQWIYYPDSMLPYHRILVRHNFCHDSKGYWTETRTERTSMFDNTTKPIFTYINEYAYPLNTVDKPQIMNKLLKWCSDHGVYGLGRWGEHQHYNSDVTVELALNMADRLYSTK